MKDSEKILQEIFNTSLDIESLEKIIFKNERLKEQMNICICDLRETNKSKLISLLQKSSEKSFKFSKVYFLKIIKVLLQLNFEESKNKVEWLMLRFNFNFK